MERVLVLTHTEADGTLKEPALQVLSAAKELGGELYVGIIGENTDNAFSQIASCGALKFLAVTGPEFSQARYGTDVAAAEAICKASAATIVMAASGARINRILPGLAHRLSGRADMHVTRISIENESANVSRWYYRQRMEANLKRSQRPWCIALEPGCYEAMKCAPGKVAVEQVAVNVSEECKRTIVKGTKAPAQDMQTIRPDAKLLFVAGAGWTKKQSDGQVHADDASRLIMAFLEHSQASLGGSKSVVDLGGEGQSVLPFMTHLNQIGQTGSTPRHQKGLSTCCHGEEPHVVGWRFINERRAVNTDPNCSWAQGKCDVLYVADAFKVMEHLNNLLKEKEPAHAGAG